MENQILSENQSVYIPIEQNTDFQIPQNTINTDRGSEWSLFR